MHEIQAGYKENKVDFTAIALKNSIEEDLRIKSIKSLRILDVFRIESNLFPSQVQRIARELLHDSITQQYSIDRPLINVFDWLIEVKFHDNVTDNVAIAALEGIEDLIGRKFRENEWLKTARHYLIEGKLNENEIQRICKDLLANELIESFSYRKGKQ